jgi:DMSO/TMAO reductase YedYZ molybdopterin-dependent catalytic subunit
MKKKLVGLCLVFLAIISLVGCKAPPPPTVPGEVEATTFLGKTLTPLKNQGNNALAGTQTIDRATYRLAVTGLVNTPLSLSYDDLMALPQISKLMDFDCVEGWGFVAKWTGPTLKSIFAKAGVKPEAQVVIFSSTDVPGGYSSLLLNYVMDNDIILGMKINDLTIPAERGFPFQVVAESKYGYKWAKWITGIELSNNMSFRGYWESYGYNNDASVNGPSMEP